MSKHSARITPRSLVAPKATRRQNHSFMNADLFESPSLTRQTVMQGSNGQSEQVSKPQYLAIQSNKPTILYVELAAAVRPVQQPHKLDQQAPTKLHHARKNANKRRCML
ncbi:hypothetical protein M409DRAFT_59782 [Zasmidium cellare ATCC 36951]|uniref:Uncharacterized protein n=1 Tax=Zasmidium cellare ATCC 36951 TaxID=1080233 RepID=A0A6A6C3K4_ZASCE|nr:uncharacterized protein M409DRAFT_59782 [Zasmidium cellare ATCC 36951]KAF2160760.1 hypothetical protein M409DRAFT_59782 [Zasmidium cellare ATCC 36951]